MIYLELFATFFVIGMFTIVCSVMIFTLQAGGQF